MQEWKRFLERVSKGPESGWLIPFTEGQVCPGTGRLIPDADLKGSVALHKRRGFVRKSLKINHCVGGIEEQRIRQDAGCDERVAK